MSAEPEPVDVPPPDVEVVATPEFLDQEFLGLAGAATYSRCPDHAAREPNCAACNRQASPFASGAGVCTQPPSSNNYASALTAQSLYADLARLRELAPPRPGHDVIVCTRRAWEAVRRSVPPAPSQPGSMLFAGTLAGLPVLVEETPEAARAAAAARAFLGERVLLVAED